MITFGEWHKFNFVDTKIMDTLGDIYIKVFRKQSFKHDDMCLSGLMRIDDAVKMFGKYPLMKINFHQEWRDNESNYKALCALICMEADVNDAAGSN